MEDVKINYNKLWDILNERKITKTRLHELTGVSTNAIANMGKCKEVPLHALITICRFLDLDGIDCILSFEKTPAPAIKYHIAELMEAQNVTPEQLAQRAAIAPDVLERMKDNEYISMVDVTKLCKALNCNVSELVEI